MPPGDVPDQAVFEAVLRNQGLTLDPRRLAVTLEAHAAFRPALNRMREIELDYLDPIEPGHVQQWIDGGGSLPRGARR